MVECAHWLAELDAAKMSRLGKPGHGQQLHGDSCMGLTCADRGCSCVEKTSRERAPACATAACFC
eukprot:864624-Lingulodinium_polyedra.AAC.1